jgi:pre-mRNA-splicing factor CWC22
VQVDLEAQLEVKRELNVFKLDAEFDKHEEEWVAIRRELLGESSEDEGDGGGSGSEEDTSEDEEEGRAAPNKPTQVRTVNKLGASSASSTNVSCPLSIVFKI